MDIRLPKFDVYHSVVAPNCFKSHANFPCSNLFQKMLSGVQSKISPVRRNIVPTRESLMAFEKDIFTLAL